MNPTPTPLLIQSLLSFQPNANTPFLLFKAAILLAIGMYIVFALVMIRQIDLMTKTVKTPITPMLKLVGLVHMIASVIIWFVAFIAL